MARADALVLAVVRENPGLTTAELRAVFLQRWRADHRSHVDDELLGLRLREGLERLMVRGRVVRAHVWTGAETRVEWRSNGVED